MGAINDNTGSWRVVPKKRESHVKERELSHTHTVFVSKLTATNQVFIRNTSV